MSYSYEEELSKNGIGISLKMKYTSLPSIDCPDMSNIDVGKGDRGENGFK